MKLRRVTLSEQGEGCVQGPGQLLIDAVSLFPSENARAGSVNPWPFRKDLLDMLKALRPR